MSANALRQVLSARNKIDIKSKIINKHNEASHCIAVRSASKFLSLENNLGRIKIQIGLESNILFTEDSSVFEAEKEKTFRKVIKGIKNKLDI